MTDDEFYMRACFSRAKARLEMLADAADKPSDVAEEAHDACYDSGRAIGYRMSLELLRALESEVAMIWAEEP